MILEAMIVFAVTIPVEIPDAAVGPLQAQVCPRLRKQERARVFSDLDCANWIMRTKIEELLKAVERRQRKAQARDLVDGSDAAAEAQLVSVWPDTLDRASCGDGILDDLPEIDYVEECDDGNLDDGDGCSHVCTLEAS